MTSAKRAWREHLLPQKLLCSTVYRIARSKRAWIRTPLINWFARTYRIDLEEAEHSSLSAYPTLNAFFTRGLKEHARPLAGGERTIVSPADGTLSELGTISEGQLLQAKGMYYRLDALLAADEQSVERFEQGAYLTVYLAPHNYHRVHVPLAGALTRTRYVPGERFSVNARAAAAIERLFSRNERAICWFDTAVGQMVVVLVGALNVSSISTASLGEIRSGAAREWREPRALPFARGAELGRFNLGSTVIVLFERGAIQWDTQLAPGASVRMGEALGRALEEAQRELRR